MAHYKGPSSEGNRAVNLLKKREKAKEELERTKQKISEDKAVKSNFAAVDKFATSYDAVEEQLQSSTIGLVTLDQMREKQEILVREREKQLAAKLPNSEEEKERRKAKRRTEAGGTLSFNMADEEDDDENGESSDDEEPSPPSSPPPIKKVKVGKNPAVDTSFLPDKDREEAERQERKKLGQVWLEKQERIKDEEISITYSYWDGSGHRRHAKMKKGNSIYQFLQICLENLRKEFSELRVCSVDNLMYVKEDLIIPQHYSFYDFIINKARGKSGPLFSFDVHEDIRLVNDATVEKDESHAGKVVLRNWYERNKHIFPASRWEPYDPEKHWDKYTISDNKK